MEINLLQEYTFVCLDILITFIHNKDKKIENKIGRVVGISKSG